MRTLLCILGNCSLADFCPKCFATKFCPDQSWCYMGSKSHFIFYKRYNCVSIKYAHTRTHRHRYIDKLSCQSNCLPAQRQLLLPLLLLLPSVQLQMDKCCLTFTRLSTLPLPPSTSLYLSPLHTHTHRRKHNKATHNDCTHAFSPL